MEGQWLLQSVLSFGDSQRNNVMIGEEKGRSYNIE